MKLRPLFTLAVVAAILSSCGVNDLEDRLDKVENVLGTNEPIKLEFKTTDYEGQEVFKKVSYGFKTSSYYSSAMFDYQNGTYYIEIQRLLDIGWDDYANIEFEYDANTKEVSDANAFFQFRDKNGQRINPNFSADYTGHTFELKVHSFNGETGAIEIEVIASTDETAENNEYDTPMSANFKFKGKLGVFID